MSPAEVKRWLDLGFVHAKGPASWARWEASVMAARRNQRAVALRLVDGSWTEAKVEKRPPRETETGRIDAADPRSWAVTVAAAHRNLEHVANALISIAKDEKRRDRDRRTAIYLLGGMETKESLAFLIDNVALDMPLKVGGADALSDADKPCEHAMHFGSWETARAILASLDEPKTALELSLLTTALKSKLSGRFARAVIDEELSEAESLTPQRRKNLEVVRRYVATG